MKNILSICAIALFVVGCATGGKRTTIKQNDSIPVPDSCRERVTAVGDSCEEHAAVAVVVDFLNWYKDNYNSANNESRDLVSYDTINNPPKPVTVNWPECDAWLKKIQESGFVSDKYIEQWRNYFQEQAKSLKAKPEYEGEIDGFGYDFVLFTNDVDWTLNSIKDLQIEKIKSNDQNQTLVTFYAPSVRLTFYLSEYDGKWLIDNIVNGGGE